MPFGALLALARLLVAPGFGGSDAKIDDRLAAAEATHLRVPPEIADQNDLVDAASHDRLHFLRTSNTNRPDDRSRTLSACSLNINDVPDLFKGRQRGFPRLIRRTSRERRSLSGAAGNAAFTRAGAAPPAPPGPCGRAGSRAARSPARRRNRGRDRPAADRAERFRPTPSPRSSRRPRPSRAPS